MTKPLLPVPRRCCRCCTLCYLLKAEGLEVLDVEREDFVPYGVEPESLLRRARVSEERGGRGGGTEEERRGAEVEETGQLLQLVDEGGADWSHGTASAVLPGGEHLGEMGGDTDIDIRMCNNNAKSSIPCPGGLCSRSSS